MKVLVNGGLNLSVLDGWWAEAYEPEVGWAMGDPHAASDDEHDAEALFRILQEEVVPSFYERDAEGLPRRWLRRVRASLSRLTPQFSANRMLREYVTGFYHPAEEEVAARLANDGAAARELESWAHRLTSCWSGIRFGVIDVQTRDAGSQNLRRDFLNDIPLEEVAVELFANPLAPNLAPARVAMDVSGPLPGTSHGFLFRATTPPGRPVFDWTPRVIPASRIASIPAELPLITWQR